MHPKLTKSIDSISRCWTAYRLCTRITLETTALRVILVAAPHMIMSRAIVSILLRAHTNHGACRRPRGIRCLILIPSAIVSPHLLEVQRDQSVPMIGSGPAGTHHTKLPETAPVTPPQGGCCVRRPGLVYDIVSCFLERCGWFAFHPSGPSTQVFSRTLFSRAAC